MRLYRRKSGIRKLEERISDLERINARLSDQLEKTGGHEFPDLLLSAVIDLENIGIGLFNLHEKTLRLSDRAVNILGLKRGTDIIDKESFLSIVAIDDRADFENLMSDSSEIFRCDHPVEFRILKTEPEREVRYISSRYTGLKIGGQDQILFTFLNITKQEKSKKELLRAKEKAEESDKLKNAFFSHISREIRVPMNSIAGFAELLNIGNISSQERNEFIKIIRNQSNNLLKLLDDLSEIAKFEAGEVKINKSPCNISLLMNELLVSFNQIKKLHKKEHLELRINIEDNKGLVTYTDSGRLHQLMSNLITNAIKFTDKGFVEFGYTEKGDGKIEFYVKDTGVGLTREEQKHIFDRLAFGDESTARKYETSGLGLSLAKGIAKLLGGKIWVDSEPGNGSVFYFTIPFEQVPEEDMETIIDEEVRIQGFNWKDKLILVAEDDDVNFKFLETLLLENQAKVLRAVNGYQVIELCKSISKIDLILMDIKMPEMDGFEATREVRKFNPVIPIIAQTAYATTEDYDKCIQAGCNDQVSKPIDVEILLIKINRFFIHKDY